VNEDKATRYHRLRRRAAVSGTALGAAVLLLLIVTGGSAALRDAAARLAGPSFFLTLIVYVVLVSVLGEAIQLWSFASLVKNEQLTARGPYVLVRNPMYLGRFFLILGIALLFGNVYITLAYVNAIPGWVTILVVSRDLLIIGAVVLSWMVGEPMGTRPHWVSKVNTLLQIALAALVLGALAFAVELATLRTIMIYVVGALTVLSGAVYLVDWVQHMAGGEAASAPRLVARDQRLRDAKDESEATRAARSEDS